MNTPPARSVDTLSVSSLAPILVRELTSGDRQRLLTHFLALSIEDRLMRFGHKVPDQAIENYVHAIDFSCDSVFGVFDHQLQLAGVGHLAYLPVKDGNRTAEFGVSVLKQARGHGIGSKLFARAAIRSRNTRVTTLYMHCLLRNAIIMHIARKSGMQIEHAWGEADAYLSLPPADHSTIIAEMLQEQAALFDYTLKRQACRATQLFESLLPSALLA